jgi:hypothetical protein
VGSTGISEEVAMGIMGIVAVYVGTAMLLAPTIFVAVQWVGHENVPRRRRRLSYSVLAALMWPVLVLGLVQFLLILAVRKALHRDAFVIASTSDADESDTTRLSRLPGPCVGIQVGTPAV